MQTLHQDTFKQTAAQAAAVVAPSELSAREQLSALADGECAARDWDELAQVYAAAAQLRQSWAQYHCISAALRGPNQEVALASPDFLAAVMARIAQQDAPVPAQAEQVAQAAPAAANDAVFGWKLVAACASLAAVAAVGWQLVATPPEPVGAQWAQTAPTGHDDAVQLLASPSGAVVLRNAQLDEYVAAHRQFGGVSALQMPTGFLRNATYEIHQHR